VSLFSYPLLDIIKCCIGSDSLTNKELAIGRLGYIAVSAKRGQLS